jgi:hypothetical protein
MRGLRVIVAPIRGKEIKLYLIFLLNGCSNDLIIYLGVKGEEWGWMEE